MKVLVISARGLHLGHLGCYGNEWVETPAFDRLAAEGVVFDGHLADRPDADGAYASWRGGRYCLPAPDGDAAPPNPAADLLHLLRQQGVRTALVRDVSRPTAPAFAEGWDASLVSDTGDEGTPMEYALDAWQEALDGVADSENWLLWLELATPLPPWDVPEGYLVRYLLDRDDDEEEEEEEEDEEWVEDEGEDEEQDEDEDEEPEEEIDVPEPIVDPAIGPLDPDDDRTFLRLQRTCAGAVTYLDAGLGLMLEELQRRGLLDEVLLIVTGDHGFPLGEHGVVGPCRPWLHDELVHVPLLLRWPGRLPAGRRVAGLTQPVDLMPTLLDAFGVPPPVVHGHNLLPLARGEVDRVRDYACSGLRMGESLEWALRSPEWAYLLPLRGDPARAPRLYVKPDDRWEVNDVAQHHLELCERLAEVLRVFVEATRRPGPLRPPELA